MLKRFFAASRPTTALRNLMRLELIEALQQPGCALCQLAQQKNPRYVETLLDNAVIDVDQRDAWRAVKGFCSWHAWMAVDTPQSASSLALLYEDVLHHEIRHLAALANTAPSAWRWRPGHCGRRLVKRVQRWLYAWRQAQPCPACRLWQEQERLYMTVILQEWQEPTLTAAFAQSNGVCLPHLARLMAHGATHRHLSACLQAQQDRLQALQADLQEFIRKQDYRFAHESYGPEADSWQRVVAVFVGMRSLSPTMKPPTEEAEAGGAEEVC